MPVRIQMISINTIFTENLEVWFFSFLFPLPFPCMCYYTEPQTWINSLLCFVLLCLSLRWNH